MNGQLFYLCGICGANLAGMIKHSGVPMCCCGREMLPLQVNAGDAPDDHIFAIKLEGHKIHVAIVDGKGKPHPSERSHYIEWIYLHTQEQGQRKMLQPGKRAETVFVMGRMESAILYAYCSKHGLWQKALPSSSTYQEEEYPNQRKEGQQ